MPTPQNPEAYSRIRWKIQNGHALTAVENALVYSVLGNFLGYPEEDLLELEGEALAVPPSLGEDVLTEVAETPIFSLPHQDLAGKFICLVVGHEPGGGADGERAWNIKCAREMKWLLEARGATVLIYYHKTRSYSRRVSEMKASVKRDMPEAGIIILLHYNAVSYESAHGHEFYYGGFPELSRAFADQFQKDFPESRARGNKGIRYHNNGRGSLMIKAAPAPCVLTEPFFISNPTERSRFQPAHQEVAASYATACGNYLLDT